MNGLKRVAIATALGSLAACGLPSHDIGAGPQVTSRDSVTVPVLTAGEDLTIAVAPAIPDDPSVRVTEWDDGTYVGQDSSIGPISGVTEPTLP